MKIISSFEGYSAILSGNVTRAKERFEEREKDIEEEERKGKISRRLELERELEEKEKRSRPNRKSEA